MIKIFIAYEKTNGDPVTLANVENRAVLVLAARAAIQESRELVRELTATDPVLGELQFEESARLERALFRLVPGLRPAGAEAVA